MENRNREKKYQVFISSTYEDLKEERLAVCQTLLELGCIPVGMEQFPASGMSQMEYISRMLDTCDYYILLLAGRYGTKDPVDGVGYTEKEYDYAISRGIPVMSFLHYDLDKLPSEKCEKTEDGKRALNLFRKKVALNKLIKYYSSKEELQKNVAISLHKCMTDFPATGWIRADDFEVSSSFEKEIEEYMEKHTMTNEDIDKLFKEAFE